MILKRAAITGLGIVSSLGHGPNEVASAILGNHCAFQRSSVDPDLVVAPISDFEIRRFVGPFKERRCLHQGAQFAVAAAVSACRLAKLDQAQLEHAALFVAAGPNLDFGSEFPTITDGAFDRPDLSPLFLLRFLPNTAAAAIARLLGIHGENLTIGNACAASTQAVGEAFRRIRYGHCQVALAVGGDCRLHAGGLLAYKKANALHRGSGSPAHAMRPFDRGRDGFVPGEGGAAIVLEDMESAKMRNAPILGEVIGYGSSLDGGSLTDPDNDGHGARIAVNRCLSEANLSPDQVSVVAAHGTGTLKNDDREAKLLDALFASTRPQVLALKSWIGHLASACGIVELAILLSCLKQGFLPPILALDTPCLESLNFLRQFQHKATPSIAILESFGFGGQNAALAIDLRQQDA